mgnify:CR=1 FL=1
MQKLHSPDGDVVDPEQLDLLHEVLDLDRGGDEVHEESVVVDGFERAYRLFRSERRGFYDDRGLLLQGFGDHLGAVVVLRDDVLYVLDPGGDIRFVRQNSVHT